MGKPIMAICDGKPVYMNSLMTMFQQKKELPFEIYGFTKSDALDEFCSNHQIALLIISEKEYNELQKAKRNAAYLTHLDRSFEQLKNGDVVVKSMEDLEHMADE